MATPVGFNSTKIVAVTKEPA
ncbi:MAG: hypothetical protein HW376_1190, partial [candidate division NC10 bacterium]|nr:hypothetical protein [candidate division NC10 bacterium]